MNKTERRAKKWIMSLGYSPNEIVFQRSDSPDFLLSDGSSIEVKRIKNNSHTITIDECQWLKLKTQSNCSIAIFNETSRKPLIVLKVSEINPPFGCEGYIIKIREDGMKKWRKHLDVLRQLRNTGKRFNSREEFWKEYHVIKANY